MRIFSSPNWYYFCCFKKNTYLLETEEAIEYCTDAGELTPQTRDTCTLRINEFPDEVLVQIFSYLPPRDSTKVYLVCRKWRNICNNSLVYRKRNQFALVREQISAKHPFVKIVLKSRNMFPSVKFWSSRLENDLGPFWNKLCPNLMDVVIFDNDRVRNKSSHINNKNWVHLLEKAHNIERLHLTLHISEGDDFLSRLKNSRKARFDNLRELSINGNISPELINFFDRTAPNVQSLHLLKFSSDPDVTAEVIEFLRNRISSITSVSLNDFPGEIFLNLLSLTNLQLSTFKWDGRIEMQPDSVVEFLQSQKSLNYLELSIHQSIRFTECFPNLRQHVARIFVEDGDEVVPLNEINNFPNLERLHVSAMFESILDFEDINENTNLTELKLRLSSIQQITKPDMILLSESFPNLRKLELKQCCSNALPVIFDKLRQLEEFKVSIYNFSVFIPAMNTISNLKGLKTLALDNCSTAITDLVLINRLEIEGLIKLELTNCGDNITDNGIMGLVVNCPAIKYLNICCLENITDEAIDIIASNLIRLEELNIKGCRKLTRKSLDFIFEECKNLKTLKLNSQLKVLALKKFAYLYNIRVV